MKKKILIVGFGGHAKSVLDAVESSGEYEIAGFVDKEYGGQTSYKGYGMLGTDDDLQQLFDSGITYAAIGIGSIKDTSVRENVYHELKRIGYTLPVICDSSAIVAGDAVIEEGTFLGKRAVVNADAHIGKACIINTGAIVEHDCRIGNFVHIAVGGILCGNVTVGDKAFVGAGTTVVQQVTIGANAVAGAGQLIMSDVPSGEIIKGGKHENVGNRDIYKS